MPAAWARACSGTDAPTEKLGPAAVSRIARARAWAGLAIAAAWAASASSAAPSRTLRGGRARRSSTIAPSSWTSG
jgi:hypothetical protein